jgi:tetratricopeptide (TPR) repeat protein
MYRLQPIRRRAYPGRLGLTIFFLTFLPAAQAQLLNPDSLRYIIQTTTNPQARLDAASYYLTYLHNRQQYDSVVYFSRLFYAEAEKTAHKTFRCNVHYLRALRLNDRGRADSAISEITRCEQLASAARDTVYLCRTYDFLAQLFFQQKNLKELGRIYQQASTLSAHFKGRILMVRVGTIYANMLGGEGRVDTALVLLRNLVQMASELPPDIYHEAIYWLGNTLVQQRNYAEAEVWLTRALRFFETTGMEKAQAGVHNSLGEICLALNKTQEALTHFNASLNYGRANSDMDILGAVLPNLARTYKTLGQWQNAWLYQEQTLQLWDSLNTARNKLATAEMKTQFEAALKTKENEMLALELRSQKERTGRLIWLIATLGLLLAGGTWAYRYYQKKREQVLTAETSRKQAELELKSLRAQLDPHFLYNFFHLLGSKVKEGQHNDAAALLAECSTYFRYTMEQTAASIINLEEEIEGLENYLGIQQKVMENRFTYAITVDETVDVFGIELPAMLFQPLAENAIKHGFQQLPYAGHLSIHFTADEHFLYGTVTDNGQPAPAAQEHLLKTGISGQRLTQERLQLFSQLRRQRAGIFEASPQPNGNGYRVIVGVPLPETVNG